MEVVTIRCLSITQEKNLQKCTKQSLKVHRVLRTTTDRILFIESVFIVISRLNSPMPTPMSPQEIMRETLIAVENGKRLERGCLTSNSTPSLLDEDFVRSSLISLLEYVEGEMPRKATLEVDNGHDCYEYDCDYCEAVFRNNIIDEMVAKLREIKDSI